MTTSYYCIYCNKSLLVDEDGVVTHDDVPHPENATYDEESRPQ